MAEIEEELVPETPHPINLRLCTVLEGATQQVDPDYPVGLFEIPTEDEKILALAVILVTEIEGKLVVAVPASCWNRILSKRILPPGSFLRPVSVTVDFVNREPDGDEEPPAQKIWLGFLSPDFESYVVFDSSVETIEPDEPFDIRGPSSLPEASSLAAAVDQHFAFASATSGVDKRKTPKSATGRTELDSRLTALETAFADLASDVKKAVGGEGHQRPPALRAPAPSRATLSGSCPPGLGIEGADTEVVTAARNAGIPESQIQEMVRLAVKGKARMQDLPRPKPRAASARKNVLSDSDDEPEEVDGFLLGTDGEPALEDGQPLVKAISKLTEIASHLSEQKKKSKSLDALLDGAGSLGAADGGGGSSVRKNAAALRALRRTLRSHPEELTKIMQRNMEEDFAVRTQLPGADPVPISARAWLELRSRVQGYQTPLRLLWSIGGILDALRSGLTEEAKARCYLALAMGDQLSIDRGQWILAAEISLEDSPPISVFNSHSLPSELEAPYTKLVDGRWIDLFLQKLNEFDSLAEKKKKLSYRKNGVVGELGSEGDRVNSGQWNAAPKKGGKKGSKGDKGKGKGDRADANTAGGSADPQGGQ